jgi:hypothetical protein
VSVEVELSGSAPARISALSESAQHLLDSLKPLACNPAHRVYALLDGAPFDDLPGSLAQSGIACRSLYCNVQDAELIRSGPWLVDIYHAPDPTLNVWGGLPGVRTDSSELVTPEPIEAVVSEPGRKQLSETPFHASGGPAEAASQLSLLAKIVGDAPVAVYWVGDNALTEWRLWHHLRTLNMVLIPKEFLPSIPPSQFGRTAISDLSSHEPVLFRHADGNVLAEVLPVLDGAQFSRYFGPATSVFFLAPDHPSPSQSTLKRAALPDDAPPAATGLLKMTYGQMDELDAARRESLTQAATGYVMSATRAVRDTYPEPYVAGMVVKALAKSNDIGASTRNSHYRWALMYTMSGGKIYDSPRFHSYIGEDTPGLNTDEKLLRLLQKVAVQG